MAVPEESMQRKAREKMNKKSKKMLLITQEIKLAKALAMNSKKIRDKSLRGLKKWLLNPLPFDEDDFMRIWKGLFYTLWMSDKPLVQEECAENIAQLIHCRDTNKALNFFKAGLNTLKNEWFGIDQLRLDKFLMFVRRFLRQAFIFLKTRDWSSDLVSKYNDILSETVLDTSRNLPMGLTMQVIEIYLEELAKVTKGKCSENLLMTFITPFIKKLSTTNDARLISHISKHIFRHLMRQSDVGIEYHDKFHAWKKLGFPGDSPHCLTREEVSDEENLNEVEDSDVESFDEPKQNSRKESKILDPRAGRVDVVLPQLRFDSNKIVHLLAEYKFVQGSTTKSRKAISKLIEEFKELANGVYPLGIKSFQDDCKSLNHNKTFKSNGSVLTENFQRSEGLQKRPQKRKLEENVSASPVRKKKLIALKNIPNCFIRNSGVWFVEDVQETENQNKKVPAVKKSSKNSTKRYLKDPLIKKHNEVETKKMKLNLQLSQLKNTVKPEKLKIPQIQEDILQSPKKHTPLKNDETSTQNPFSLSSAFSNKIAYNLSPRRSMREVGKKDESPTKSHKMESNKLSLSGNMKRVNINLKLNTSQEIHEHQAQIKNSPGIPFDASKKPSKPLLKPFVNSPINPFYRKKLEL